MIGPEAGYCLRRRVRVYCPRVTTAVRWRSLGISWRRRQATQNPVTPLEFRLLRRNQVRGLNSSQ
jgi:hypothetical protein